MAPVHSGFSKSKRKSVAVLSGWSSWNGGSWALFLFLGCLVDLCLGGKVQGQKERCKRWVSVLFVANPLAHLSNSYSHVYCSIWFHASRMDGCLSLLPMHQMYSDLCFHKQILALRIPKVMRGGGRPGRGFHRIKSVLGTSAAGPWEVTPQAMSENPGCPAQPASTS